MNLLLDSHTLLWLMEGDPNLSATAAALLADPANRLYLSRASVWEIAIKSGLGKLGLSVPYQKFLATAINGYGALRDGLSIVGVDSAFDAYGVTRLW